MSRLIEVEARPAPQPLDTSAAAVIVVDMQNDFGTPGGMFDRAGIDIKPIQAIVEPIGHVLRAARANGIPVIFLKMAFHRTSRTQVTRMVRPGASTCPSMPAWSRRRQTAHRAGS